MFHVRIIVLVVPYVYVSLQHFKYCQKSWKTIVEMYFRWFRRFCKCYKGEFIEDL